MHYKNSSDALFEGNLITVSIPILLSVVYFILSFYRVPKLDLIFQIKL